MSMGLRNGASAAALVVAFLFCSLPALAGDPAVKVGMSLAEVRAAVAAAGWYPPSTPYCKAGYIESETGYCGLIPASILNAAPEARSGATDYPAVQMCYKDHHGKGFRAMFSFKYGEGHAEPPPASLKLVSWDMHSVNCISE
jgi:hypothetical protein